MFRTLDRYLLRSFMSNYVLALLVMVSLYVVLDLFLNLDEFTEANKPISTILASIVDYYGYNLPLYFSQLSGVIALFAACGTFARLHRQNEVTAVLASGTSLYRLATPVVLAALAMNALLVLDQEVILPHVAPKLVRERADVEGQRVKEVWFVRDGDARLVSAMQFSAAQKKMRGLVILELETDPELKGQLRDVVTADFADWDQQQHGWRLQRGVRLSMTGGEPGLLGAEQAASRTPVSFYSTNLTPEQIKLRQTVQWMQFLSVRQLGELEAGGDVAPEQIAPIKHGRFTLPVHNMILVLLGLPFFMTRMPGSILTQVAKALAVCSLSFIVAFGSQQMVASMADVPAALPTWVPIFIFGPVAVVLLENVKT